MTESESDCYGLVLSGGLSSRMGVDKAQLRRNKQTMLAFAKMLLSAQGLEVLVSGGANGIPDLVPQAGPLGGIYSVLKTRQPRALLVVPVDMPMLTPELLGVLLEQGEKLGVPVCYEDCYLPLYLPVTDPLLGYLEAVFAEASCKPRSLKKLLEAMNAVQVPVTDKEALMNTNTPEEWQQARARFGGGHDQ
ncbi:molybdenum cofactor guanylyltransferase [Porticoccus sp.]